ncbi:MAG: deoxyribose-phosphate aldolase [Ignavibacteriae bacterium]|nr:deoxyribose-phosphate aldolase [Ignavibacteriota bacterium]
MDQKEIDKLIQSILSGQSSELSCCKDGTCSDGLCVIHNKEGVKNIVQNGAARITASIGIEAAGGVETDLARLIDHTLLKPEATKEQIIHLCNEAKKYNFASVCVNPCYVSLCAKLLRDTAVKVCTVIGFPLGATSTATKAFEAEHALRDGAKEIDMVINVGMLKSGEYDYVENDIFAVVTTARRYGALTKIILETTLLTDEEKIKACLLTKRAGADFVKTSTGFSKGGATVGDIALMRKVVGSAMGVKASGGVRTREEALAMVASGADRIGASASVKIVSGDGESKNPETSKGSQSY